MNVQLNWKKKAVKMISKNLPVDLSFGETAGGVVTTLVTARFTRLFNL